MGSLTAKAVILNRHRILASAVSGVQTSPASSAMQVMDRALQKAGVDRQALAWCVGTGYGREHIPFAQKTASEIACHARGAQWSLPSVRTVIDIGGQDCKAIRLDESGAIARFSTNDKCAAGTGRFLEVMADLLGVALSDLGELSSRSRRALTLANACAVWAQAEVICHLNARAPVEDIAAGINQAMANRVAILANTVGLATDVCLTGGVAKNSGVVKGLEQMLGVKIRRLTIDPQITGALGAALMAREYAQGGET